MIRPRRAQTAAKAGGLCPSQVPESERAYFSTSQEMHKVHSAAKALPLPVELHQTGARDLVVGRVRDRLTVTSSLWSEAPNRRASPEDQPLRGRS